MEEKEKMYGKEISKISNRKFIRDRKIGFYVLIIALIFFSFQFLYIIINDIQFKADPIIFWIVIIIIFIPLIIFMKIDQKREPNILFENGIIINKSPLKKRKSNEVNFVHFDNVEKIRLVYCGTWISFKIHQKNGKNVIMIVDDSKDFNMIIKAINNFKGKMIHELL